MAESQMSTDTYTDRHSLKITDEYRYRGSSSQTLFREAKRYIPGGVNSPVRSFKAVGGEPIFIKRAQGSKIYSEDGREYIDYVMAFGPLILGHSHKAVIHAVRKALNNGAVFGAATSLETRLAKEICEAMPSIEMVRLVNSGTEACMSAVRLARGWTKRRKIIKFIECYHGHYDELLNSPVVEHSETIRLPYNETEGLRRTVQSDYNNIAAIIVEPVGCNKKVLLPRKGFLEDLRLICDEYGIILIFDEVITGFRLTYGGAGEHFGIKADLTCLGKILGGGFPIGAVGGRRDIMSLLAPEGPVYQAGTFSGNPITVSAGLATLGVLKAQRKSLYKELAEKTRLLCQESQVAATQIGSIFHFAVQDYSEFFHKLLRQGVYFAPSNDEANFVSAAHSFENIEKTIRAIRAIAD